MSTVPQCYEVLLPTKMPNAVCVRARVCLFLRLLQREPNTHFIGSARTFELVLTTSKGCLRVKASF